MPLVELGNAPDVAHRGRHPRSPRCAFQPREVACMDQSELRGPTGSRSTTGTAGPRSRSGSRGRRLQQLARSITSDGTLKGAGFRISASSLVRSTGQQVDGCTCTPYSVACWERVRGERRSTRLEIHAPWCRGKRRGAGGSSDSAAASSSGSIEQGELPLTSPSTSPRVPATSTSGA